MTTLSNETVPTSEQEQSLSESACTERQMGRSLEQAQEEGVSCSSNSEEPNAVHYAPHELGRKGEAAAARFLKIKAMKYWSKTGPALREKQI